MRAKSGKQSRISRATLILAVVCMVLYVVLVAWSFFAITFGMPGLK